MLDVSRRARAVLVPT